MQNNTPFCINNGLCIVKTPDNCPKILKKTEKKPFFDFPAKIWAR